jgi:hypothetical protein
MAGFDQGANDRIASDKGEQIYQDLAYKNADYVRGYHAGFKGGLGDWHGSASDRGAADSWYRRPREPHYWPEGTYKGEKIVGLTQEEIDAYHAAYDQNEADGNHKDWG